MSAYVMQDDLLSAELTVRETLYYAANLRMAFATPLEREERVQYDLFGKTKLRVNTHDLGK